MNLCNAIITMMKLTRYIVILISLVISLLGCVDESEQLTINTSVGGNTITIAGRITAFDDRLVDTRAGKTMEESYTSSMAMAIFPIVNNVLDTCVYYDYRPGSNVNFTIERATLRKTFKDANGSNPVRYDNEYFAFYLFANTPDFLASESKVTGKTLDFFLNQAYGNTGIRRPQKGFPMVGSLGDYVTEGADGNKFVFIPTETIDGDIKIKLPLLNGTPNDYIPIPLKSLYAKFSFDIKVQPNEHIQGGATPTFTLERYTLNNVPDSVKTKAADNKDHTTVLSSSIITPVGTSVTEGGTLEFDFYTGVITIYYHKNKQI